MENYGGDSVANSVVIQLNGHDRIQQRPGEYFTKVQRYQHHTGHGRLPNIHMYSFAIYPEEHEPSGTCNFSRIDNALIHFGEYKNDIRVYGVNYNVLRVMSGMAGVAFSN